MKKIKETGDIFLAWSDREWLLNGATVHTSFVGFDDGRETLRVLDGESVEAIHADLTSELDSTSRLALPENNNLCFMGTTSVGKFDVDHQVGEKLLSEPINPNGSFNSDVVLPWVNSTDVFKARSRRRYILDFGSRMTEEEAALYIAPFELLKKDVQQKRSEFRSGKGLRWWRLQRPRPEMRQALAPLKRFFVTSGTGKHRIFTWLQQGTVPDHALLAFARDDDYFFGVLQSRAHEVWARKQGTQLREAESGFAIPLTLRLPPSPFPGRPARNPPPTPESKPSPPPRASLSVCATTGSTRPTSRKPT